MQPLPRQDLGIGVGLRVPHLAEIFRTLPEVGFFEILTENFLVAGGPPRRNLRRILDHYRVVMHGVSLSIASAEPLDFEYLRRVRELCRETQTPWFSDHLSWTTAHGTNYHDLLPMPFTEEVCDYVAERARIVQDFVDVPLALENLSSYVTYSASEMSEGEFFAEVCRRADIGMLFDVNNVFVSATNHDFQATDYLDATPWERVVQVHLAGPSETEDGLLLDTHDHPVRPEVWELYAQVHERTGGVSTLLEWDSKQPSFQETLAEARLAERYRGQMQAEA